MTAQDNAPWVLEGAAVKAFLQEAGFRDEAIHAVCQAAEAVQQSPELPQFLEFLHVCWQLPARHVEATFPPSWQMLAVVSKFPETLALHHQRGIPRTITHATLRDLDLRLEESQSRFGQRQFSSFLWWTNHLSGNFFQLGRLQYGLGTFGFPARVYRSRQEIITLAEPNLPYSMEGWLSFHSAEGFETQWSESPSGIQGNAFRADGSVHPQAASIAPDATLVLRHDTPVLQLHIPWGGKLLRADCVESLRAARDFFSAYFPEVPVRGICTTTWLLDYELRRVLPPEANIVAFGKLFHLIAPQRGNDKQILERVFNASAWENCRAQNSLQSALLAHHQKGHQFRTTGGFLLFEEIDRL